MKTWFLDITKEVISKPKMRHFFYSTFVLEGQDKGEENHQSGKVLQRMNLCKKEGSGMRIWVIKNTLIKNVNSYIWYLLEIPSFKKIGFFVVIFVTWL